MNKVMDKSSKVTPRVLVMMGSYNGEEYIAQQIESILEQQNVEVELMICDDGSTDKTCNICESYALEFSNVTFKRNSSNKGVAKNFMDMLYEADGKCYDYYAFSDQDDYWLPEKLEKAVDALEKEGQEPALYYSDVCNTDENLQGEEYEFASFSACSKNLPSLLVNNWASGCTMVFNSGLRDLICSFIPAVYPRNHDGWIHLIALSCAKCIPDLGHSYIKRRISEKNIVGRVGFGIVDMGRVKTMMNYLFSPEDHYATDTARALLTGYADRMSPKTKKIVSEFALMKTSSFLRVKNAFSKKYYLPYKNETFILSFRILLNKL